MALRAHSVNRSGTVPPMGAYQGTQGGLGQGASGPRANVGTGAGGSFMIPELGPIPYLWALIALELALTAYLRNRFRRYHGG